MRRWEWKRVIVLVRIARDWLWCKSRLKRISLWEFVWFRIILFYFENFITVSTEELLELCGFCLPVVQKTLGMLIFQVQIKGGVTEVNFIAVTLITDSIFIKFRIPTFPSFLFLIWIGGFLKWTAHLVFSSVVITLL